MPRCSDTARSRGDELVGTAAPVRRWLLVEHPGPWAVDAWAGSGISTQVRRRLDAELARARGRVLLVRRPGRQVRDASRSWAVVGDGVGPRGAVWGPWRSDNDLLAAVPLLRGQTHHSRPATTARDAVLLVCAHGRHDTCCAVRGRPVAAALQRIWPDQTWECSHVGGDRFAANLVVLPDGAYYGNLDASSAVDVVRGHLGGTLHVDHLRGLSTEPPVAQVAIAAAHREHGPAAPLAFTSTTVRQVAEDRWEVRLRGRPPWPASLLVDVVTFARPPALLTCRAAGPTSAMAYRVVGLRDCNVTEQSPDRHG
jgi:hypothetical protein